MFLNIQLVITYIAGTRHVGHEINFWSVAFVAIISHFKLLFELFHDSQNASLCAMINVLLYIRYTKIWMILQPQANKNKDQHLEDTTHTPK